MFSFSEGQGLCPLVQRIRQLVNVYGGGHSALGKLSVLSDDLPIPFYSLGSLHTCLWVFTMRRGLWLVPTWPPPGQPHFPSATKQWLFKFWGSPPSVFSGQSKTKEANLHLLASQNLPTVPKPVQNPNTCSDGYQSCDLKSYSLARVLELVKGNIILNWPWRWFCFSQSPNVIVLLSCILSPCIPADNISALILTGRFATGAQRHATSQDLGSRAYLTDPPALSYFGRWEPKYMYKYMVPGPGSLVNLIEKCSPWVVAQ